MWISEKNIISEFYAPLVPEGYDFISEIGSHVLKKRKSSQWRLMQAGSGIQPEYWVYRRIK